MCNCEWQPIESAILKDGSTIILGGNGCSCAGYWSTNPNYWNERGWYDEADRNQIWYSDHPMTWPDLWMPLPEPPKANAPDAQQASEGK
jgi:hypothetical protein